MGAGAAARCSRPGSTGTFLRWMPRSRPPLPTPPHSPDHHNPSAGAAALSRRGEGAGGLFPTGVLWGQRGPSPAAEGPVPARAPGRHRQRAGHPAFLGWNNLRSSLKSILPPTPIKVLLPTGGCVRARCGSARTSGQLSPGEKIIIINNNTNNIVLTLRALGGAKGQASNLRGERKLGAAVRCEGSSPPFPLCFAASGRPRGSLLPGPLCPPARPAPSVSPSASGRGPLRGRKAAREVCATCAPRRPHAGRRAEPGRRWA